MAPFTDCRQKHASLAGDLERQPDEPRDSFSSSKIRLCPCVLFYMVVLLAQSLASHAAWSQTTVPLNAKGTFLHADNADAPAPPTIIDLAALGLSAGQTIELRYAFAAPGFSFSSCSGPFLLDGQVTVLGVFSASSTLLAPSAAARVPDAIDAGTDVFIGPTFWFGEPADIPEDFRLFPSDGFTVAIPPQASHLFLGVADSHYSDNCGNANIAVEELDLCPLDDFDDADEDGICGDVDNCPEVENANQADVDEDGLGDACDPDSDNDGYEDAADNCTFDFNPDQADGDRDGAGNVCDADDDGDGIGDAEDACMPTSAGAQTDETGCSIAQLCPCVPENGEWKNHGAYVSCVAHAAQTFVHLGLIATPERDAIVAQAAESDCGQRR